MARTAWTDTRRARQLTAAAADGMLHYAEDGTLLHRRLLDADEDIPASGYDAALVADLLTVGHLRHDPANNTVTSGAP